MYNKMKNKLKQYNSVGTVPKSSRKIAEMETKWISLTDLYMTTPFRGLVQALH